jgi:type 2 lantibiotic biosynthesis protein LanM
MVATPEERREVAARAQSLSERLGRSDDEFDAASDAPIDRLREAVGGERRLSRRLSLAGVDEETAAERLETCGVEREPLPRWVELAGELQAYLADSVPDDGWTFDDLPVSVETHRRPDLRPFEHVLVPIVEFAVDQLERTHASELVTDRAVYAHGADLFERLQTTLAHPMFVGLKIDLRSDATPNTEGDIDSRQAYRRVVEGLLTGGCRSLFRKYPLAARWAGTVIRQWIERFEEFTARLERDTETVADELLDSTESLRVVDIRGRGDFHDDGRRVFEVTFEGGETVAYKPRSLGTERGFSSFLSWVNRESSLRAFRVPTCLDRDAYGWIEWIEPAPCEEPSGANRYFRQAGAMICLLYALRFADGNIENVAAVGDQIVVYDVEALAQPVLPDRHDFGESSFERIHEESVLRTGLVPQRLGDSGLRHLNGLDKPTGEIGETNVRTFTGVNTDAMELEYEDSHEVEGDSLPVVDGEPCDPRDHAEEIVSGFRAAYGFLLDRRETLLSPEGPLAAFEDGRVRFFYRESAAYGKTVQPLWTSPYLRSGLEASFRVERLTARLDLESHPESHWRVYRAERAALWQVDVPRFSVGTTSRDVQVADEVLSDELSESPLESVRGRIGSLDEADRAAQVEHLVVAYDSERLLNPTPAVDGEVPAEPADGVDWDDVAREECRRILDRVEEAAVRRDDGTLGWYSRINRDESLSVRPLRHDLYDGRVGVAAFAAAVWDVFGWERGRELATEAIDPVVDALDADDTPQSVQKFGAGHGAGSLLYGLVRLAEWLEEPQYLVAAERVSDYVTPDRLASAEALDLIGGVAGVVPGLLTLHAATDSREHLDRAVVAGERLLDARSTVDGVETWPLTVSSGEPRIGPAHGVSGISFALDRLATVAGRSDFREAARTALSIERDHYRPEEQNWPDYRLGRCRQGWCAGRSGVGLTRLAMADDDDTRRALERALQGSEPEGLMDEDDICCGNFSRVEFHLTAARRLDRPELRTTAERVAIGTVRRARRGGGYTVAWQTDNWYSKSLFLGEMGVGYSLCRLAGNDLPSLLLWE